MEGTHLARVTADVHADATTASEVMDRSVTKQVSHWARIGREVEARTILDTRQRLIRETVQDDASLYDSLSPDEQAVVRAIWSQRVDEAAATVDLAADKRAEGRPYATVGDDGQVVIVHPDGSTSAP